jgi:hypothetical protein
MKNKCSTDLCLQANTWFHKHILWKARDLIKLDGTKLLLRFYITLKIHKNPVVSRSIYAVHFSMTSLAFALVLRALMVLYNHIKTRVRGTALEPFYCVCLSTDEVLVRIKHAHTTHKRVEFYFHSRDFISMYLNLDPAWCINAILQLLTKFENIQLTDTFQIRFGRRHRQDFNPNIWCHLESLEDTIELKISLDQLA